jgi:hypothetical protein
MTVTRRWILAAALALAVPAASVPAQAQEAAATPAHEMAAGDRATEALAVIERLFEGMHASDTTMIRSVFDGEVAHLVSSHVTEDGTAATGYTSIDDFVRIVGDTEPGSLEERYVVRDVHVDDRLVTVVTPYTFHFGGTMVHCGVDVFLLAETGDGWKIVGLADTRRREGCEGWLDE